MPFRAGGQLSFAECVEGCVVSPDVNGKHNLVGWIEIVEGNKLAGGCLDPTQAFRRKAAFASELGLAAEVVLGISCAVALCFLNEQIRNLRGFHLLRHALGSFIGTRYAR